MYPKQMAFLLTQVIERERNDEWEAMLRRPDALPLPPVEPTVDVGARLAAVIRGWLLRLPADSIPPKRIWSRDDEMPGV
jgi:broad specificity phosphatase PhoE